MRKAKDDAQLAGVDSTVSNNNSRKASNKEGF